MSFPPAVSIPVDLSNPGQYFACCGLFEVASRQSNGVLAWFTDSTFHLTDGSDCSRLGPKLLIDLLKHCEVESKLDERDANDFRHLNGRKPSELSASERARKKELVSTIREAPVLLDWGDKLTIDWFLDSASGGSDFKTWAGQQTTLAIARAMQAGIIAGGYATGDCRDWLSRGVVGSGLPFNFDATLGLQSSSLDVGFSLDVLKMAQQTRPLLEFAAFIGLQRFRPKVVVSRKSYAYGVWQDPLPIQAAGAAASLSIPVSQRMAFRLLYRTKYLKSFLPSTPYAGS